MQHGPTCSCLVCARVPHHEWPAPCTAPHQPWTLASEFCCSKHAADVQYIARALGKATAATAHRAGRVCAECTPTAVVWPAGSTGARSNGWFKGIWLGPAAASGAIEDEWRDVQLIALQLVARELARDEPSAADAAAASRGPTPEV